MKEHPSICSLAPLSSTDQLSPPPCAAGGLLPILKLVYSIFCHPRAIYPGKPGSTKHGVPHGRAKMNPHPAVADGFESISRKGSVPSEDFTQQICHRGVLVTHWALREPALTQGPSLTLSNLFSLFCAQICLCKMWLMLFPGSCLFSSLACCVSDIPAEIRLSLCYSNRNKLGASEMQAPHTPWASITKPSSPPHVYRARTRDKPKNKQDKTLIVHGLLQAQERPKTISGGLSRTSRFNCFLSLFFFLIIFLPLQSF